LYYALKAIHLFPVKLKKKQDTQIWAKLIKELFPIKAEEL
jgi:hypothetical protein